MEATGRMAVAWRSARCVFCVALFVFWSDAHAGISGGYVPASASPPDSFLSALIAERLRVAPHDSPLPESAAMERHLLVEPASPYSAVRPFDAARVDDSWVRALHALARSGMSMTMDEAGRAFRWDLGFTRAHPGTDVPRVAGGPGMTRTWVIANMTKSGVDLDIFLQARELVGAGDPMLAAPLAMAAQLLREQARDALWARDPYTGLWRAPLDRFTHAHSLDGLGEEHLSYMMRLLENELSSWRERRASGYGLRQLPTAARIARVAAAYRSRQYTSAACHDDGSANREVASASGDDTERPLCFADMVDRRVVNWFVPRLFDDLASHEADPGRDSPGLQRLVTALARLRPAWSGAFVPAVQTDALDTRVITAALVHELLGKGAVTQATVTAMDEHAVDLLCHGGDQ